MKVLALNGSPRMKTSSTWHILKPLLKGMEGAGAETEVIHLRQLDLSPCIGCYTCWVRTPGVCIHKDPMDEVIEKYVSADLIIYGTPLYHFNMSGIMKTFIDRTLPVVEPWLVPHATLDGLTGHPVRNDEHRSKMMLVSPCGFPEFEHFESLVATFKQNARMGDIDYIGEILRPFAEALSRRQLQFLFTEYYATLEQAGREIIESGHITPETQAALNKPLFPGDKQTYYELSDNYWKQQMDRFKVPEEARHAVDLDAGRRPMPLLQRDIEATSIVPLDDVDVPVSTPELDELHVPNQLIADTMAEMYRADVIPNLRATIQLHLIPSEGTFDPGAQDWLVELTPHGASAEIGRTPFPTLTISTPHEVWLDIGLGKIDPVPAFADGLYEVDGSMNLLRRFPEIFAYPRAEIDELNSGQINQEDIPMDLNTLPMNILFAGMAAKYNAESGGDLAATIQFDVTGEEAGQHYIAIADSKATYHEGVADSIDMTIHTPSDVWRKVSTGELEGSQAMMNGMYKVEDDISLLLRMGQLFSD